MYLGSLTREDICKRTITELAWSAVFTRPTVEGSTSKLTHMLVGKTSFFTRYWTENVSLLLVVGSQPRREPDTVGRRPLHRIDFLFSFVNKLMNHQGFGQGEVLAHGAAGAGGGLPGLRGG